MVGRGTRLLGLTLDESIANGKPHCLLLDFTGNTGKHKLVGPLDCLAAGEEVDDDLRREAERLVEDGEVELDAVLDEAKAELERRRQEYRQSATAKYFTHDVDPFFGEELPPEDTSSDSLEPASPEERRALLDLGFKGLPPNLGRGDARRMFAAVEARNKKGLCSLRQAKQLARCGIDGRAMSKAAANARMSILVRHDWDPHLARHELRELDIRERSAQILNNGAES
jgi:superfamily II DNA or RNA helicase